MERAGTALSGLAAAGTSALFLAGNEQKYFSELFSLCGGGQSTPEVGPGLGTTTVGGSKVAELFRASQLPAEMLHQYIVERKIFRVQSKPEISKMETAL